MLRNTKTKKVIDQKEETELLESLLKSVELKQKQQLEIEDGEVVSDDDGPMMVENLSAIQLPINSEEISFTPPLHTLKTFAQEEKVEEENNNTIVVAPEVVAKPKKKSVLELPMPPIIFNSNKLSKKRSNPLRSPTHSPQTPDMKPEHFKHQEKSHFKEICNHLNVNPAVISPLETFTETANFQPTTSRPRPTVISRAPPTKEFNDRTYESYKVLQQIGEGTYGKVFKALDLSNNQELVAMKYVRMEKEYEGFPITGLREVKILRELNHPNVIQLREIVNREDTEKNGTGTYLVFEYMNHDLMGLLDNESMVFDEVTIYRMFRQILEGLNYCHQRNILHRDLKCSNILVNNEGVVKLADFGLGRRWICDRPYTNQVISLWYRPIELLLREEKYGPPVDMWSLGCIFGELFQRRAVFPFGTEIEMIQAIFNLCGTPTKNSWPEVKFLPGYMTLKPKMCRRTLMDTFNRVLSPLALDLFDKMLCLSPIKRITAEEALKSNWIQLMDQKKILDPLKLPVERDCHEMNAKLRRKKKSLSQPTEDKN